MKLQALLRNVEVLELHADPETEITSVAYDSRRVERAACSRPYRALRRTATGLFPWRWKRARPLW